MMGASEVSSEVHPASHPDLRAAPGRRGLGLDPGRCRRTAQLLLRRGRRGRGHLPLSEAREQPGPAAEQLPAAPRRHRPPGPAPGRAGPAAGGSRARARGVGGSPAHRAEPAGAGGVLPGPRPRPGPALGPPEHDPDL